MYGLSTFLEEIEMRLIPHVSHLIKSLFACFVLTTLHATALAEVTSTNDHSFELKIMTNVPVPPNVAYEAFLRVDQWWNPEHSYFGKSEYFSLDPVAGGCFCEREGKNEVQHMQVVFVQPNKQINMLGGLGPLQMMAAHGAMGWKFEAQENGSTNIVQVYRVTALNADMVEMLAKAVNSVQQQQQERLVAYIKK